MVLRSMVEGVVLVVVEVEVVVSVVEDSGEVAVVASIGVVAAVASIGVVAEDSEAVEAVVALIGVVEAAVTEVAEMVSEVVAVVADSITESRGVVTITQAANPTDSGDRGVTMTTIEVDTVVSEVVGVVSTKENRSTTGQRKIKR